MTPAEQTRLVEILKSLVTTMGKLIQILTRPGTNTNERAGLSSRLLTGFPGTGGGSVSNAGANTRQIAALLSASTGSVIGGAITGASSQAIATVVGIAGYVDYSTEIVQYRFADNNGSPSRGGFNGRLSLAWRRHYASTDSRRRQGNWIDVNGVHEGSASFHPVQNFTGSVASIGTVWSINVAGVVQKQIVAPFQNKGIHIKSTQSFFVGFHGRLAANVSQRPRLVVQTEVGGPQTLNSIATCSFASTSDLAPSGGTRTAFSCSKDGTIAYIQFPVENIVGSTVSSAVMELTVSNISSSGTRTHGFNVFEADPPLFLVAGSIPGTPVQGYAQNFDHDREMFGAHPDVTYARDFTGSVQGVSMPWTGGPTTPNTNRGGGASVTDETSGPAMNTNRPVERFPGSPFPAEFIYNPETGTTYKEAVVGGDMRFGYPEAYEGNNSSNYDLPPRPLNSPTIQVANFRYYMRIEAPWQSDQDATKWFGFDNRWGWWSGSGWYPTGGNSGGPQDGFVEYVDSLGLKLCMRGNSQRGHLGEDRLSYEQAADPHPYDGLVRYAVYFYHVDLDGYGSNVPWGYNNALEHYPNPYVPPSADIGPHVGVVYNTKSAKWVCVEWQMTMNTVVGPFDALNNGVGLKDGDLKIFVDGVLVSQIIGWRNTQNKDYGIQAAWFSNFYGGNQPPWYGPWPASYCVDNIVLTRGGLYIGPRGGASVSEPAWSSSMVTDEFKDISSEITQSFSSVTAPWDSFHSRKVLRDYSGGVYNQYWGALGATILHGGGHSSTNDNSVYIFDFNDMKFKRVSGHSFGVTARLDPGNGGTLAPIGNQTKHDVDTFGYNMEAGDGLPAAAHTYDNLTVLPPSQGGAAYGSFIRQPNQAIGVAISRNQAYAHVFGFESLTQTSGPWAVGNNTMTNVSAGGAAAYDSARNKVWWIATPTSPATLIRWLDVATMLNSSVSCTAHGGIGADTPSMRYDPVNDMLVLFGPPPSSSGLPLEQRAFYLMCANPSAGWTQATLSQAIPCGTGRGCFAFDLCTHTGKWYGITSGDKTKVFEFVIPSGGAGTWTVTPRTVSNATNWAGIMYVMSKRWSYMPAIKRFSWVADVATDILYVYKPPGV